MHSLHTKDLIVALFVVEHGSGKVIEDCFCRQRTICLAKANSRN